MADFKVFVGSSREGLSVAQAIQLELQHDAVCTIWYQGVFGLMEGTLEALVAALPTFDFAIIVLTPDDLAIVRDERVQLPRDNVLFELGLFMGHLGRKRVFVLYCDGTKLPTDLAGVTLAAFSRPPDKRKLLSHYPALDLVPHIGPGVQKIRSAITKAIEEEPQKTVVHYIASPLTNNEYYSQFLVRLETEVNKLPHVDWKMHQPLGNRPSHIYTELNRVMTLLRDRDAVILTAMGLENDRTLAELEKVLNENPRGRVVFVGRQPPSQLVDLERSSYIGMDNRKVGILAAFALHEKLGHEEDKTYYLLAGPGGPLRSKGFIDGIEFFEPGQQVKVFQLEDVDRDQNYGSIQHIIGSCPEETPVGIFVGNDENAFGVIRAMRELNKSRVFVVGCDATKEMCSAIDRGESGVVATVRTEGEDKVESVLAATKQKISDYIYEPQLYPVSVSFMGLKSTAAFQTFWQSDTGELAGGEVSDN